MKKKLIVTILAVALLTGCGKSVPKLANGNDAFITFGDGTQISVDELWAELKKDYGLREAIEQIDRKVLEEEYADKKKDALEYAQTLRRNFEANYPDEATMNQVLEYYGYSSLDQYEDSTYINYLQDLAVDDYVQKNVTEKEMKDYYKNESVGDIDCDHILVKPKSDSSEDLAAAKAEAEKIIAAIEKDIKSGTKAKDAFAKYKDDDTVTYQTLGYFNKGDMVAAFENAAYALKKGAYTKSPVKTSYGYHIILKNDEKEKDTYDNLKESIKVTIADKKIEENGNVLEAETLVALRKKHGVKWHDSEMEDSYNKYMNALLNQSK